MYKLLLFSFIIALSFYSASCAVTGESTTSPSDFFSDSDRANVLTLVKSKKNTDGSFGSGIADTYFAVNISRQFPESSSFIDSSLTCQYAKQFLNNKQSLETLYYAISTVETLQCGSFVGNDISSILLSGLKPSSKIESKFYSSLAISKLLLSKHITLDDSEFASLIPALANLQEPDGTFRSEIDLKGSSALNSGYVLNILASIPNIPEDQDETSNEISDSIETLFSDAHEEEGDTVFFTGESRIDDLKATFLVLSGANALLQAGIGEKENLKSFISKDFIVGLAEFAVKHKRVSTLQQAFYLTNLLNILSQNEWHVPLVITLSHGSLFSSSKRSSSSSGASSSSNESGLAKIKVTDIYGKFATPATVYIVKAYPVEDERDVILTNQEAVSDPNDNTTFSFNFLAKKPEPGYYTIELSVTPKNNNKNSKFSAVKDVRNIKVVSPIDVTDVEVKIMDSKDPEESYRSQRFNIAYPNTIKEVLTVTAIQFLNVNFKVKNQVSGKPVKVHQAFVKLTNNETGHSVAYNCKSIKNGYELLLDLQQSSSSLHATTGKYNVDLVVGDPFVSNPVFWNIASLNINYGKTKQNGVSNNRRNVKTLEGKIGGSEGPRDNIEHKFREKDKRPHASFSLLFTLLVLAPILLLLGGIGVVGANLENYPGGANSMMALGFHVCLGLILGLFVVYWFVLNIVQTLGWLLVLSGPTLFCGLRTLQAVNANRRGASSSKN